MYRIKSLSKVKKKIIIPPDKSISHRAIMLSAIAKGKTSIKPFILSEDTKATLDCIKKLGIKTKLKKNKVLTIEGKGLYFPRKEKVSLNASESGTTIRILSGLLAGQRIDIIFDAKPALRKRPMKRITSPLRMMGAKVFGRKGKSKESPPLTIKAADNLRSIQYKLPVASAQVKSAVLLASLYANGQTQIIEPAISRDHTERMLSLFKAKIARKGSKISLKPSKQLKSPKNIFIPSDFSSAAFFIVLGLILPKSEILIKNVNINPSRAGLLTVLNRMGAKIKIVNKKKYYEPYADVLVKSSKLKATTIKEKETPLIIDEVPILCVAASFAKGKTIIKGIGELKVKESDRINSIVYNLKKAGVDICGRKYKKGAKVDWLIEVKGGKKKATNFKSFSDHRIAMSMIVFGSALSNKSTIDDIECINKSFPEFIALIESLNKSSEG